MLLQRLMKLHMSPLMPPLISIVYRTDEDGDLCSPPRASFLLLTAICSLALCFIAQSGRIKSFPQVPSIGQFTPSTLQTNVSPKKYEHMYHSSPPFLSVMLFLSTHGGHISRSGWVGYEMSL